MRIPHGTGSAVRWFRSARAVDDRRFDWRPNHDGRSRDYAIRSVLPSRVTPRRVMWSEGVVLDQGSEGACVGFGWTADLLAEPEPPEEQPPVATAERFALEHYRRAKRVDEWPGEAYSGTSVLAGAKVLQRDGLISQYRWCFSPRDVRDAVIREGPVVIGVPWYSGMYTTRPDGLVVVDGDRVGGHCIVLTGYDPALDLHDGVGPREVFRWRNSWGADYGVGGSAYVTASDLASLLSERGEACVPVGRRVPHFPVRRSGSLTARRGFSARWSSLVARWGT
jgi:hypothetical protein